MKTFPAPEKPEETGYNLYIVLMHTNSLVSRAIAAATQDQYTHAALALDRDLGEMYSFGRRWSRYPFWGCFHRESLGCGFLGRNAVIPGVVLRVPVTSWQYNRARAAVERFCANPRRYHYDVAGLVGNALGLALERQRRFTCSKFVAAVLTEAGVVSFEKPLITIRPQELLDLPAQVAYQGDLKGYALARHGKPDGFAARRLATSGAA